MIKSCKYRSSYQDVENKTRELPFHSILPIIIVLRRELVAFLTKSLHYPAHALGAELRSCRIADRAPVHPQGNHDTTCQNAGDERYQQLRTPVINADGIAFIFATTAILITGQAHVYCWNLITPRQRVLI